MEDRKLTEKESLEVITSMIAQTKQRYIGDGRILLMWGYLVTVVSILVWVMLASTGQGVWNFLWFAIPLIGSIATPIMARRQHGRGGVKTFSDTATSRLWTIAGISEIVVTIVCIAFRYFADADCWSAMLAYTLIVIPAAEMAQGLLIRENSLVAGALAGLAVGITTVCCIAGGIVLSACWYMPLFIFAFVAMMIVPGHILNHKAGKEK